MISLDSKTLSKKINIHLLPTRKFKTVLVSVFLHQTLEKELASQTALLPAVLERGTREFPSFRDLKIRLEELYGAELRADVLKKGERHILSFSLEVINDKFAPGENLLQQGLSILKNLISDPFLENGVFKKEYVRQEKEQLAKEIQGLINDKVNYALESCVQEMCSGERFGVFKYGSIEDLDLISPESLYDYYRKLLRSNPIDVFVVGEIEPDKTFALVQDIFDFSRNADAVDLPPIEVSRIPQKVRLKEEYLPVAQGKLTLGYRINTSYRDDDYVNMLFYNSVLGGFPHSKLFQNVREKASLAYYAFSRLEKHKGIQLIGSGIEAENYERALEIIKEQVEELKKGNITREEMEFTKRGLISQYSIIGDSPYSLVNFYLDGLISRREEDVDYFIGKIQDIKEDDVIEAARKVYLDTIYFLCPENGKGGKH
ncbi:MAG TPA: insulinase family protein [Firmicutes bacterium]|nr:insulinase family protein [Bacillota bacterium]